MSIVKASQSPFNEIKVIDTGFPKLNDILGIGGVPFRRITEISGKYSVGKTTLALTIVAQAQKAGYECLWCDDEYSWDERYSKSLGVDTDSLDLLQESTAEVMMDEIEKWAQEHKNAVIVLDSIGSLRPRAEQEKQSGERTIGAQAGLIAKFVRKMVPIIAVNNIAFVALNHVFLDVMSGALMTSGGAKLSYHKSVEIRLSKSKNILKQGENVVGRQISAKIIKTKLAGTQDQSTTLNLVYGAGFSATHDRFGDELAAGIITKKGNTFYRGEIKLGVGQTKAIEALKELTPIDGK